MGLYWPSVLLNGEQGRWGKLQSQARGRLGEGQGLVYWMVRQRWLKSWEMTVGSATVDVSPRSWSF